MISDSLVQSRESERQRIAAQTAEWIARNGQPETQPIRETLPTELMIGDSERIAIARKRGGVAGRRSRWQKVDLDGGGK